MHKRNVSQQIQPNSKKIKLMKQGYKELEKITYLNLPKINNSFISQNTEQSSKKVGKKIHNRSKSDTLMSVNYQKYIESKQRIFNKKTQEKVKNIEYSKTQIAQNYDQSKLYIPQKTKQNILLKFIDNYFRRKNHSNIQHRLISKALKLNKSIPNPISIQSITSLHIKSIQY